MIQSNKSTLKNHLFFILILAFIVSCSYERELARRYVKMDKQKSIFLALPSEVFKSNLKTYYAVRGESFYKLNNDSISWVHSVYLKRVNDSLFLEKYKMAIIKELNALDFNVYGPEQIDDFLALNDSSYIFNLAQIQLEESIERIDLEYLFDDTTRMNINLINLNSWFELERNKVPDDNYPVLYSSYAINDEVHDPYAELSFGSRSTYTYNPYQIDTMRMEDIYELASFAGKYHAINIYDYLMNTYIQDNLPKDKKPKRYFHYDLKWKNLHIIYYDGFTEIDP